MEWVDVVPEGRIWSYAVYHRIFDPRLNLSAPYAVVAVELDSGVCLPGRFMGSLNDLTTGAEVEATFTELEEAVVGPAWCLKGSGR